MPKQHTLILRVDDQEQEIVARYARQIGPKPNMSAAVRAIIREWYMVEGRQWLAEMEATHEPTEVS